MALRIFKCPVCGNIYKTLKEPKTPPACEHDTADNYKGKFHKMEEVINAPGSKFMVAANKATGTSKLKDQQQVLTERARNYAREVDADDTIQINLANGLDMSVKNNLLNEKGERRRKIDDI